ncbi:polysaccharide deacetylase family protein, partial [Streptomyces sp. SID8455]|nr:polysaccharide deacetylase family protein [Streptomyces sp. SID8455]
MTHPAPRGRHDRSQRTAGKHTGPQQPVGPRTARKKNVRKRNRRKLPMRYLLPFMLLVALLAMLMLRGYVHSEILADHRVRDADYQTQVPKDIRSGGPVIDARSGDATTLRIPDRRIVLTFDDGPDPVWTPKVLDKLKEYGAHGVFFVTGNMAARHPELVERMVAEGHEIGLHTFNHPDL